MIDHLAVQLAVRGRLLTLSVVSVTDSISATSTGYARASGSFIDDGFEVGMEVSSEDFVLDANNDPKTITAVSAGTLTAPGTAVEGAASRTLTVGIPSRVEWEGLPVEPDPGAPWMKEEYLPGGVRRRGLNPSSIVEALPIYVVSVSVPANVGVRAARKYQNAIVDLFPPGLAIALAEGGLRVRGEPAPFSGQLLHSSAPEGYLRGTVSVPLIAEAANSI